MYGTLPIENELKILHDTPISMEYKGDKAFSEWQEDAREVLKNLIGLDRFKKCESRVSESQRKENETFTEIRFSFQSEEGYFVPCILCVPKKSGEKKPPLMICVQGHGTGMHISLGESKYPIDEIKNKSGDRNFAIQCVNKGFCALCLDQRNFGEKGGNPRPVCHASSLVALLTGRSIIAARVWDIMRAIDVLEENYSEYFDTDRIGCMGNSGGGTATLYASVFENRIKAAISSCAFCNFEKSIGEQNHCECNYIPGIRNYFDMAEIAAMSAPKPLVIVSGMTDGIFPIDGAKSEFERLRTIYYSACSKPENCVHVIGEEGHRFYAKQAWPEFDRLTKW